MPTLYVRDVPEEIHDHLKARASRSRRSVSAETIALLEQCFAREEEERRRSLDALSRIGERRRRYPPPPGSADSLTMLREGREQ